MNRPTLALSVLLSALVVTLLATGSANSQTGSKGAKDEAELWGRVPTMAAVASRLSLTDLADLTRSTGGEVTGHAEDPSPGLRVSEMLGAALRNALRSRAATPGPAPSPDGERPLGGWVAAPADDRPDRQVPGEVHDGTSVWDDAYAPHAGGTAAGSDAGEAADSAGTSAREDGSLSADEVESTDWLPFQVEGAPNSGSADRFEAESTHPDETQPAAPAVWNEDDLFLELDDQAATAREDEQDSDWNHASPGDAAAEGQEAEDGGEPSADGDFGGDYDYDYDHDESAWRQWQRTDGFFDQSTVGVDVGLEDGRFVSAAGAFLADVRSWYETLDAVELARVIATPATWSRQWSAVLDGLPAARRVTDVFRTVGRRTWGEMLPATTAAATADSGFGRSILQGERGIPLIVLTEEEAPASSSSATLGREDRQLLRDVAVTLDRVGIALQSLARRVAVVAEEAPGADSTLQGRRAADDLDRG